MTAAEIKEELRIWDLMSDPYKGDLRLKRDEEIFVNLIRNKQPIDYNYMMSVLLDKKHTRFISNAIMENIFPHCKLITCWCGVEFWIVQESIGGNRYMTQYERVWKGAISFWNNVVVTNYTMKVDKQLLTELITVLSNPVQTQNKAA